MDIEYWTTHRQTFLLVVKISIERDVKSIQCKNIHNLNIFLRAYNICSPEYIKDEKKFIYNLFSKLGYKNKNINNTH